MTARSNAATTAAVAKVEAEGQGFNLPVLQNPQGALEVMKLNMEGAPLQFERIKIPSGGGMAFEVPGDDDEPQVTPKLTGVILDHYPVNAYWCEKFAGQSNPPSCVALDGRLGTGNPGGACAKCSNNEWGSDAGGRGKACKNLHRVYLLPEGEMFPYLIALPPTSLKLFNVYMRRLTSKLVPFYAVITTIKLQKVKNKDGIEYSQAVVTKAGDLDPQAAKTLKGYIDQLRPAMRAVAVEGEEYVVDGDGGGGNGGGAANGGGNGQAAAAAQAEDDGEPF